MILIHPLTASNPVWLCLLEHRTGMQAIAAGNIARLMPKAKIVYFLKSSAPAAGGAQ